MTDLVQDNGFSGPIPRISASAGAGGLLDLLGEAEQQTRRDLDGSRRRRIADGATVGPEIARIQSVLRDIQSLRKRLARHVATAVPS